MNTENILKASIATTITQFIVAPELYIQNKVRFSDQDYSIMTMLKREGTGLWKGTFKRILNKLPSSCILFPLRDYLSTNVLTGRNLFT